MDRYHKGFVEATQYEEYLAFRIDLNTLAKKIGSGDRFVCDKCGAELIIALTLQDAKRLNVTPGIYCPTSGKHLFIHIYLKEVRDKMFELFEKINNKKKE